MHNVTQDFLKVIKLPNRQLQASVTIRDVIFGDSKILDLYLEESVNPADSFTLGAVASSKFEVTVIDVPNTLILENATANPKLSLLVGSNYEEVPLGVFTVDEISKDKNTVKLICYDNMIKLEKAYFSNLNYPANINAVAQEICAKSGVELATILPNININKIEGYTYREAISFIASFLGGFARFNRLGKLEIITYSDSDFSITGDNYFNLKTSEKPFNIGRLACQVGDKILSVGTSGNEVKFENPIMTQAQLNNIYSKLKALSYMPYNMDWQGNMALTAGDKLTITDVKGNTYNTLLMQQKISYKGGLKASATAVGKTEQAQEFNSSGSIKNTINRMVVEQANIKVLLAEKATIEDLTAINARIDNLYTTDLTAINAKIINLEATSATITQLNAQIARIDDLKANSATITQLNAASAKINVLEGKAASIDTLLAGNLTAKNMQTGFITAESGLIANGAIKDAMILSLSADKINSGKVNTNIVTIQSSSGNMLIADNTIQIKDASRVRVQIGKDSSNDYNMYVWDSSGKLMFDATGLKADGIKSKIIRDDMVSDTANINATKIEKESLIIQINGATTLLKASKVKLDIENQTLDLAFTSLKSTVITQGTTISSQGTAISTIQGQISSKIWQQDITNSVSPIDDKVNILESNYSTINQTVNGISTDVSSLKTTTTNIQTLADGKAKVFTSTPTTPYKVGDIWTGGPSGDIMKCKVARASGAYVTTDWEKASKYTDDTKANAVEGNLNTLSGKVTTVESKQSTLEQDLNGFKTTVSNTYSTKTEITTLDGKVNTINSTVINHTSQITQLNNSITSKVSQTDFNTLTGRVSTAESSITQLNNSITTKVSQTELTEAISGMQGLNLLLDSGTKVTNSSYLIKRYIMTENMIEGEQYVIRIKGSLGAGKTNFGAYLDGGGIWLGHLKSDGGGYFSLAFKGRKGTLATSEIHIYVIPSSVIVSSTIEWIKLEKGIRTTDYTASPGDLEVRISTAELKLQPGAITQAISDSLSTGTKDIITVGMRIDKEGMTLSTGGKKKIQAKNSSMDFFNNNQVSVGGIGVVNYAIGVKPDGFGITAKDTGYFGLGYNIDIGGGAIGNLPAIMVDPNGVYRGAGSRIRCPIYLAAPMQVENQFAFGDYAFLTTDYISGAENIRLAFNPNLANSGIRLTSTTGSNLFSLRAGYSEVIFLDHHSRCTANMIVDGNFTVKGAKNNLLETENYGDRLVTAYETMNYLYGDNGFGSTDDTGECVIAIDDIFLEMVNTNVDYFVSIQAFGDNAIINPVETTPTYFKVKGDINCKFMWEVKAYRKDYELARAEVYTEPVNMFPEQFETELNSNPAENTTKILESEIAFNLDDYLLS